MERFSYQVSFPINDRLQPAFVLVDANEPVDDSEAQSGCYSVYAGCRCEFLRGGRKVMLNGALR